MKNLRGNFFASIGKIVSQYPWFVLIIAFLISAFSIFEMRNLSLDTTWLSLAPQKSQSVQQFKKIIENFGSAVPIIVSIKGDDKNQLIDTAKTINQDLQKIKQIKDVNYHINPSFTKKNGLKLLKAKDLKRMRKTISDFNLTDYYKNLNNNFESQYINESDEPLSKQEKNAVQSIDGLKAVLQEYTTSLQNSGRSSSLNQAVDESIFGPQYFFSRDKKMILLFVQPSVSVLDIDKIIPVVRRIEKLLNQYRKQYPNLQFGQTGMSVISRDEMDAGMHDTVMNLITAIIAIFLLLSLSFRMWSSSFLAMTALLTGVIWDVGLASMVFGRLNLFTAMVGVILIGLGIDYSIHLLTSYTQHKYSGLSTEEAIKQSYLKTGPGILTGSLTTAIAFLVFVVTKIESLKELGFVMATGIILTFLSTLFVLPALIVIKEKLFKSKIKKIDMSYPFMAKVAKNSIKKTKIILIGTALLFIVSIILIPKLHFITDFNKMEARGLLSLHLMDEINDKFDLAPDPVLFIANSLEETEKITDKLLKSNSVGFVDSLSVYLPSKEKQNKRFQEIKKLQTTFQQQPQFHSVNKQELLAQIVRLKQNIIEIGDMAYMGGLDVLAKHCSETTNVFGPLFSAIQKTPQKRLNSMASLFYKRAKNNFKTLLNTSYITLQDVPVHIRNLYISTDKTKYLINVYSAKPIWKDLLKTPFLKDVRSINPNITGMAPIMESVIRSAGEGGKYATILAFLLIFLLVLIDFRNIKFSFLALIPLILGSVFVLGFLVVTNIYFTWMTVMIVPLIIGIGIDDGVHIIHRYRIEKKGAPDSQEVLPLVMKTTGKAVVLTSLTTMIGFGSLMFSRLVGYEQFGLVLFVGIGLLLILSVTILPIILNFAEKKKGDKKK